MTNYLQHPGVEILMTGPVTKQNSLADIETCAAKSPRLIGPSRNGVAALPQFPNTATSFEAGACFENRADFSDGSCEGPLDERSAEFM